MTPTDKNLRIWIDGELLVDEFVSEDQIDPGVLAGPHREMVMLAAKRLQPWRMELGDRDADVNDAYWLN
jgi:hypothetical protein